MKLTGERKVYAAILGLGLLALIVDRTFMQPQGARADSAPPEPLLVAPKASPGAAPARRAPASAGPSLAERLKSAAELLPAAPPKDAFDPNASSEDASPRGSTKAELFRQQHKLTAIVTTDKGGTALIDGEAIRVGQTLGEFTLVAISDEGAHFERDGERVTLTRPKKLLKTSGPR